MATSLLNIPLREPPTLSWLKLNITPTIGSINKGLFPLKKKSHQQFFTLFQHCIPPIFNPKYYNLKIENYHQSFEEANNFLYITSGLIYVHQEFGYPLLDYNDALRKLDVVYNTKLDTIKMDNLILIINNIFNGGQKTDISKNDLCSKSSEFLLEPSVLIQLPWKPVLLHQWLTTALSEVLIFERDSMELRHWSMSKDAVNVASNLLSIITYLKERVMLGFAILNEAWRNYVTKLEKIERKYMESILDNVIVSTLPVLEFITSGQAKLCAENIKNLQQTERSCYVSCDVFKLESSLEILHCKFEYNFTFWADDRLFPLPNERVSKIAPNLQSNPKVISHITSNHKPLTCEEMLLNERIRSNRLSCKRDIIDLAITIIRETILNKNKIVGVTVQDLEDKLKHNKVKLQGVYDYTKSDNIHLVLRHALMYSEADTMLSGWDVNESVVSQIIALQLDVLRQEQVARITNILSDMFNTQPKSSEIETNSIENISTQIKEVKNKIKKQKRKMFWMKFRKSWKENVNPGEEFLDLTPDTLDECVQQMLDRLGRIIFHHSDDFFKNFIMYNQYFEEINIIHFVMPILVYIFASNYKTNADNLIYYDVIKRLIQMYEKKYLDFLVQDVIKMEHPNFKKAKQVPPIALTNETMDFIGVCSNLGRSIQFSLSGACNKIKCNSFKMQFTRYFYDCVALMMCHNLLVPDLRAYRKDVIAISCHNFAKYYCYFLTDVFSVVVEVYNIPEIKSPRDGFTLIPKVPRLGDLYFASAVVMDIACLYDLRLLKYLAECNAQESEIADNLLRCFTLASLEIRNLVFALSENSPLKLDEEINVNFDSLKSKWVAIQDYYYFLKSLKQKFVTATSSAFAYLPFSRMNSDVKDVLITFALHSIQNFETKVPILCRESLTKHRLCRRCGKRENYAGKFLHCRKCVEAKYPEVNYFCSKECEDFMWSSEHMAEHLEFELGLSDYN